MHTYYVTAVSSVYIIFICICRAKPKSDHIEHYHKVTDHKLLHLEKKKVAPAAVTAGTSSTTPLTYKSTKQQPQKHHQQYMKAQEKQKQATLPMVPNLLKKSQTVQCTVDHTSTSVKLIDPVTTSSKPVQTKPVIDNELTQRIERPDRETSVKEHQLKDKEYTEELNTLKQRL